MMFGNCPYSSTMWFGSEWWWVTLLAVALVTAVAVGLIALVVVRRRPASDPALDRLRMRLASGEISEADFETARRALGA